MNWAYIAGFFDGEGWIDCSNPSVGIAQSEPIVLSKIKAFLETHTIRSTIACIGRRSGFKATKDMYYLRVTGKENTRNFCSYILPYLCVKKTIAQDLMRFNRMYPAMSYRQRGTSGAAGRDYM